MYVLLFLVLLPIGVLIELLKLNKEPAERSALYMRKICLRMPFVKSKCTKKQKYFL